MKNKKLIISAILTAVSGAAFIAPARAADFTDELRYKCQDYKLQIVPLTKEEEDLCQAYAAYTS